MVPFRPSTWLIGSDSQAALYQLDKREAKMTDREGFLQQKDGNVRNQIHKAHNPLIAGTGGIVRAMWLAGGYPKLDIERQIGSIRSYFMSAYSGRGPCTFYIPV